MKPVKNRRQFLRNTALSILGINLIPRLSKTREHASSDKIHNCFPTTEDYYGEGPFYTANPPSINNNQLASSQEPGQKLILSGRVFNLDCSQVVPNTIIDVWHANDAGAYDNNGYNLRGQTLTNSQGFYIFETIKPGHYLNGATFRPSHIHFKITPPNFSTLTTQLYFQGDPYIASDAAASIHSGTFDASHRTIALHNNNGNLEGTWDIVINGNGIPNSTNSIHLDKGMLYDVSPNPSTDYFRIHYGIFRTAKVSVLVHDVAGHLVAVLDEQQLSPDKYDVFWQPSASIPDGHYFVSLKINALQVHYQKIVLKR